MADLAAIIEEGGNAERAYREAKAFSSAEIGAGDWCHRFYVQHGPTLLAVCRAAVEMVDAENDFHAFYGFTGADTARVLERRFAAFAALSAAVRGEGKETTNG